jgi:hypothetical protein
MWFVFECGGRVTVFSLRMAGLRIGLISAVLCNLVAS